MSTIVTFPRDPRYLVGTVFFVLVWLVAYACAGKSRHAMHWAALAFLPTAPFFESLNQDYWRPDFVINIHPWHLRFGLESLVLGFTFAGLSAGVFDGIHRRRGYKVLTGITKWSFGRLLTAGGMAVGAIAILHWGFHWNSVHAHIVALPVMWAVFLLGLRRPWVVSSVLTAAVLLLLMVAFYFAWFLLFYPTIIRDWWFEKVMWGYGRAHFPYYWGPVPLEEFLWAAANALYLGPAVRFCMDLSLKGEWPCSEHHARLR